jgi:hypothetical protein
MTTSSYPVLVFRSVALARGEATVAGPRTSSRPLEFVIRRADDGDAVPPTKPRKAIFSMD